MAAEDYFDIDWPYDGIEIEDDILSYDSIERETEKAYLFKCGDQKLWLPKSIIEVYEEDKAIVIPYWFHWDYVN